MRHHRAGIFAAAIALMVSTGAKATGMGQSAGMLTQKNISLAMAQAITAGAFAACRAEGSHIGVSVLNRSGALKTFADDDGANLVTFEVSRRKAYTALLYGSTSAEVGKMYAAPRDGDRRSMPNSSHGAYLVCEYRNGDRFSFYAPRVAREETRHQSTEFRSEP